MSQLETRRGGEREKEEGREEEGVPGKKGGKRKRRQGRGQEGKGKRRREGGEWKGEDFEGESANICMQLTLVQHATLNAYIHMYT